MNLKSVILLTAFVSLSNSLTAAEGEWVSLIEKFDAQKQAVAGNWQVTSETLTTDASIASRITLPHQPTAEYDFRISFTRNSGVHSIAMMFVSGPGQATFEVDAWGQHLAGLQMIDGRTMQDNSTRVPNLTLENGRRYTMMVQVRKDRIGAYLDDRLIAEHETNGSDLSVPSVWRMPDSRSLGIGAYAAATTFHSVEIRPAGENLLLANALMPRNGVSSSRVRPLPDSGGRDGTRSPATETATDRTAAAMKRTSGRPHGTAGKRVLLVIANQDFFYREYHDPRVALERAGITVEVAAGKKQTCRPHGNSGQQGSGEVMPDLAIADANASRYDAIMFSGGWGSSMYQYAFEGSYANAVYNGDRQTKAVVNRLLNDFVRQDKYVGALCHGVSVLAYSRVNGQSILRGRRAVGSPRQSPAGIYNGRRDQPLSRWNAEVNGARLTPVRSIGNPRTSEDDVLVDGKLITGEDDNSARLFGETLARLLTESNN